MAAKKLKVTAWIKNHMKRNGKLDRYNELMNVAKMIRKAKKEFRSMMIPSDVIINKQIIAEHDNDLRTVLNLIDQIIADTNTIIFESPYFSGAIVDAARARIYTFSKEMMYVNTAEWLAEEYGY